VIDCLSGPFPVLNRDVETPVFLGGGAREVVTREHFLDALYGEEEIGRFCRTEIEESFCWAQRDHEHVTGEDGFDVYETEGEEGCVEDLCGWLDKFVKS
jgi:hypothetical protein